MDSRWYTERTGPWAFTVDRWRCCRQPQRDEGGLLHMDAQSRLCQVGCHLHYVHVVCPCLQVLALSGVLLQIYKHEKTKPVGNCSCMCDCVSKNIWSMVLSTCVAYFSCVSAAPAPLLDSMFSAVQVQRWAAKQNDTSLPNASVKGRIK